MSRQNFSNWQPQTSFYKYNYGVGMQFYQPMIDYLNKKDSGARSAHPHLPWTDERGLSQYDPRKPVRSYSAEDLTKISRKTEASAKAYLRDFKATTKSCFQLSNSVAAANITRKLKTDARKKKQILKQIDKAKSRIMDDEYDPDADKKAEYALKGLQKYLRGKSAKGIENQLLSDSRRNIAESLECDVKASQKSHFSAGIRHYTIHSEVMSDRMQKQLEESFVEPLESLSAELRGFDRKSSYYYSEKRWRSECVVNVGTQVSNSKIECLFASDVFELNI